MLLLLVTAVPFFAPMVVGEELRFSRKSRPPALMPSNWMAPLLARMLPPGK